MPANKCQLDPVNDCVSLQDILSSFNSPIDCDVAWALCYQCAKCFDSALVKNREKCLNVAELKHVLIQSDGNIHSNTIFGDPNDDSTRIPLKSERELVRGLGCILYSALDFNNEKGAEINVSPELEELIAFMASNEDEDELERLDGTDDEGIERDSGDYDNEMAGPSSLTLFHSHRTLAKVKKLCIDHIGPDAEKHYRNVCRALVAEGLELATFLETVSSGTREFRPNPDVSSCSDLDKLQTMDWSRFWVQVIGELRMGVKLKKVDYSRTPIEYELTPYEILMDDIRSRRYKLRKVMVDGDIPPRVKKDAHAVILDFIRARPPLRKVSERKLPPLVRLLTPHEQLLDSIKRGRKLRPTIRQKQNLISDTSPKETPVKCRDEADSEKPKRRLIKVDFSALQLDDDDDDDDIDLDSPTESTDQRGFLDSNAVYPKSQQVSPNPWRRTGSHGPAATITHDEYHHFCDNALECMIL